MPKLRFQMPELGFQLPELRFQLPELRFQKPELCFRLDIWSQVTRYQDDGDDDDGDDGDDGDDDYTILNTKGTVWFKMKITHNNLFHHISFVNICSRMKFLRKFL